MLELAYRQVLKTCAHKGIVGSTPTSGTTHAPVAQSAEQMTLNHPMRVRIPTGAPIVNKMYCLLDSEDHCKTHNCGAENPCNRGCVHCPGIYSLAEILHQNQLEYTQNIDVLYDLVSSILEVLDEKDPFGEITTDWYDNSFKIREAKSHIIFTEKHRERLKKLGFDQAWICYSEVGKPDAHYRIT